MSTLSRTHSLPEPESAESKSAESKSAESESAQRDSVSPDLSHLTALWHQQRYEALQAALETARQEGVFDASDAVQPKRHRLRAALAWLGRGPLSDGLRGARWALTAKEGEAALVAQVIAALIRRGFVSSARQLHRQAAERWADSPELALAAEQIERGIADDLDPGIAKADQKIRGGQMAAAQQMLQSRLQEELNPKVRQQALCRLAQVQGMLDQAALCAEHLAQAADLFPQGDDADRLLWESSIYRWNAGEGEACRAALLGLRDRLRESSSPRQQYFRWLAGQVLEALEKEPQQVAAGPCWKRESLDWHVYGGQNSPGQAVLSLVMAAVGRDGSSGTVGGPNVGEEPNASGGPNVAAEPGPALQASLPSMAHLRHALEGQGVASARVFLDEPLLDRLLGRGVLVVLEEERAMETGFLLVRGYEPGARLLELQDPRRFGPLYRPLADQKRRSALHGQSALVIPRGETDLAALEVQDEPTLLHVDRCTLQPDGSPTSPARTAAIAAEGIEQAPDLQLFHLRHGESLLAQLIEGDIAAGPSGPFERWLSETRSRFPSEEWPRQLYARALEHQGRAEEAGIAWDDALRCDPWDGRSHLGKARVLVYLNDVPEARRHFRLAATYQPRKAATWVEWAELELEQRHWEEADALSTLALELEPDNPRALLLQVSLAERSGDGPLAEKRLRQIVKNDPDHSLARLRLLRRVSYEGGWSEVRTLAEDLWQRLRGSSKAWTSLAWSRWATGEGKDAWDRAVAGLQRCGPNEELLDQAILILATTWDPSSVDAPLAQLTELLAATPQALLPAASELASYRFDRAALALAERARREMPQDPNTSWRIAQILAGSPRLLQKERERLVNELEQLIPQCPGFPFPPMLLAHLLLPADPERALAVLDQANVSAAPAPIWFLQKQALEILERKEEAARIDARLPEVFPDGVLDLAGLLRNLGLTQELMELLSAVLAQDPDNTSARLQLAMTLGARGEVQKKLDLLVELEARPEVDLSAHLLLRAAQDAGDWAAVQRHAQRYVREVKLDSEFSDDIWPEQAAAAAAALALGDPEPRRDLLATTPAHPQVLATLVRIETRAQLMEQAEDRNHLAQLAPGALHTLQDEAGQ